MSHYNNNTSNSWQNRSNNSSTPSSLFGAPHDLLSYSASTQQLTSSQNSTSLTGASNPASLVGSVPTTGGVYNNPAASLLAQFAVNSVNFNNLAATIPAALVNANVLAANLGVGSTSTPGGYQWHASSQTSLQQQQQQSSSTQQSLNSRNSDQRIVSISSNSNNSNSSNFKSSSSSSGAKISSTSSSNDSVRPLMEIDTIRRQANNNNNNNNKSMSSNSLNHKNSNSASSSSNNVHSNSRDRERNNRDTINNKDRDRDRDRRSITNNTDKPHASPSSSSSSLANKHNLTITTTNLNAATNLAAANPLAQALLNQLAAQTTNSAGSNALVAALAVANAAVTASQQQKQHQHQQQQQHQSKNLSPQRNNISNKSSSVRRSRSPSSNRTKPTSNNNHSSASNSSSNRNQMTSNATSSSASNSHHVKSSSTASNHKQHSKSPVSSSTKRLSSSNIQTSSSSLAKTSSSSSSSSSSRYSIKVPKYPLDLLANNITGLKSRYSQLYIPSDFTNVKNTWMNSLPLNRSLKFNSRCLFHVMRKEAHSINENEAVFDPPDADHTWTVKVMLLAMPSMNELYKRSCSFAEDSRDRLEHPSKVIQFLVGNKGKHELMALGGAWSASLDGPDPATNSQTLINTAIRTVKALTGIDLSPCTQWFRFLDIQYNRNEDFKTIILPNSNTTDLICDNNTNNNHNHNKTTSSTATTTTTTTTSNLNGNESSSEPKKPEATLELDDSRDIETTVIFVPNVWTLMPSSVEYQKIVEAYKNFIDNPPQPAAQTQSASVSSSQAQSAKHSRKSNADSTKQEEQHQQQQQQQQQPEQQPKQEPAPHHHEEMVENPANKPESDLLKEDSRDDLNNVGQTEFNSIEDLTKSLKAEFEAANQALQEEMNEEEESKLEPTHYSKLDVKKMKVDDLRTELMARGLDTRGLKNQLSNRLKEALDLEKEKEEQAEQQTAENTTPQEENMKTDENQQNELNNNVDMQSNGENNDILYTHVNECDIDSIQLDEKEPPKEEENPQQQSASSSDSKPVDDKQTNSEKEARLERQARLEREKLYKLPQVPHIIVHPSRTAKSGKFECQLFSLAHLLDYRKEDNKESSFEVSLFAECFNEMLVRDFGFLIYKHLLSIRTEKEKELFALAATTANGNNAPHKRKLSSNETEDDTKRTKVSDENKADDESQPKTDDSHSVSKTIQLVKPKLKTVYPELLLSFVFFDTNRTNHLNERDLEDLFLCVGLSLSRSKIKALVSRVNFKDGSINYRSLTDKTSKELENETNVNFRLPSDDDIAASIITNVSYMKQAESSSSSFNKETGIIELNGSTIDVLNTIKLLDRSEQTVLKLDQKYKDAIDEIDRLKTLNKTAERVKVRLTDELNDYKKKLKDQIRTNKEMDDKYVRYRDCLQKTKSQLNKVFDDIGDVLKRGQPNVSSKDLKRKSTSADDMKKSDPEVSANKSNTDLQSNNSANTNSLTTTTTTTLTTTSATVNTNENSVTPNADENSDTNRNELTNETTDQTTNQSSADQYDLDQEQTTKSNEFENHVDQMDEETNGLSANDL